MTEIRTNSGEQVQTKTETQILPKAEQHTNTEYGSGVARALQKVRQNAGVDKAFTWLRDGGWKNESVSAPASTFDNGLQRPSPKKTEPEEKPSKELSLDKIDFVAGNITDTNGYRGYLVQEVQNLMKQGVLSKTEVSEVLNKHGLHSVMDEAMSDPAVVRVVDEAYRRSAQAKEQQLREVKAPLSAEQQKTEASNLAVEKTSITEVQMAGYIGSIGRIADNALALNSPADLQLAINGLPKDPELRRRVREVLKAKGIPVSESVNQKAHQIDSEKKSSSQGLDYEAIAQTFPLDVQDPRPAETFVEPQMGNFFGPDDAPTLAGKVIANVYDTLIKRTAVSPKTPEKNNQIYEQDKVGIRDFQAYLAQLNQERQQKQLSPLAIAKDHQTGSDDFHFGGKGYPDTFNFYFSKSHANWKNANAGVIRGYVTIKPERAGSIQRDFVDLSIALYDAGIDFTAKASGVIGAEGRTDNMVFYISGPDQAKASGLMKDFLSQRGIGEGHVQAAVASSQEGLSWAFDPDETQTKVWQEIAGSKTRTSFNSYVATRAIPAYLGRLAEAHERKGNTQQAQIFRQEATRAQAVINKLQPKA